MLRRLLILALAVPLGTVSVVPASGCAWMAAPADCQPDPHCAGMDSAEPASTVDAAELDCCQMTSAPPEQKQVAVAPVASSYAHVDAPGLPMPVIAAAPLANAPRIASSPPDRQSLLCVLLI